MEIIVDREKRLITYCSIKNFSESNNGIMEAYFDRACVPVNLRDSADFQLQNPANSVIENLPLLALDATKILYEHLRENR